MKEIEEEFEDSNNTKTTENSRLLKIITNKIGFASAIIKQIFICLIVQSLLVFALQVIIIPFIKLYGSNKIETLLCSSY